MRSRAGGLALLLLGLLLPPPAEAQEAVNRLEGRVERLAEEAARRVGETPVLGALARRFRVSGHVVGARFHAGAGSQVTDERWLVWDSRIFVDALVAEEVGPGEAPWLQAVGLTFEWELHRLGRLDPDVGDLYLDLQGLGDTSWLNLHLGRFQIPVGEGYLRYGRGLRDAPFLTQPVGSPWWWDEGLRLHGSGWGGRVGYVASLTEGRTPRDWGFDRFDQASLKLFAEPAPWLRLSASVLRSGRMGDDRHPAQAALWLGEGWARGFGSGTSVPNVVDGRTVPDGPGRLDGTLFVGVDAILRHPAGARLWLAYGRYGIDSPRGGLYDRTLHTWTAELLLEGRLLAPELRRLRLALRASGVATADADEGYLLDVRQRRRFGYDVHALESWSLAFGWRLTRWTELALEFTRQRVELAQGAGAVLAAGPGRDDLVALALGIHF